MDNRLIWGVSVLLAVAFLVVPGIELFVGPSGYFALALHGLFIYALWLAMRSSQALRDWPAWFIVPLGLWMAGGLVLRRITQPDQAYGASMALPFLFMLVAIWMLGVRPKWSWLGIPVAALPLAYLLGGAASGGMLIVAVTACVVVAAMLGLQTIGKRAPWASHPTTLMVVAGQAWDGVLTYLVVVNPFAWAPPGFVEQVALSRWLLDNTGVGFAIAKIVLGVLLSYAIRNERGEKGWALRIAVVFVGMVPAAFSTSNLLL